MIELFVVAIGLVITVWGILFAITACINLFRYLSK